MVHARNMLALCLIMASFVTSFAERPLPHKLTIQSLTFMRHLYKDLESGRVSLPAHCNTVRTIVPTKEVDEYGDVFVYNITGEPDDRLKYAQLLYQRTRTPKRPTKLCISLQREPNSHSDYFVFQRPFVLSTEETLFIYENYNNAISTGSQLISVRSPPNLLLFSQDSQILCAEDFDGLESDRPKRSVEYATRVNQTSVSSDHRIFQKGDFNRVSRKYKKKDLYKKKNRKRGGRRRKHSKLLPYPDRTRQNKHKSRFIPSHFVKSTLNEMANDLTVRPSDNSLQGMCERKEFHVQFKDIGWSRFIIAPEGFSPNYCSGGCGHTLNKENAGSNHAIIKSALQKIGRWPQGSSTHCVAQKMKSLSLLMNTRRGIVLKNYPGIEIESCSCH